MDKEQEGSGGEREICEWLVLQIRDTSYIERLEFIAEVIAGDKADGAEYLTDENLTRLRAAWGEQKQKIELAGNCQASKAKAQTEVTGEGQRLTAAHGEAGEVATNGPRGKPSLVVGC